MWRVLVIAASLLLTACASQEREPIERSNSPFVNSKPADYAHSIAADPRDPFEPVNRVSWVLNYDIMDPYLVRPVAHAYGDYVAEPVRDGVQNMVLNLEEPASFVNHLITGDIPGMGVTLVRFGVNS